MSDRSPPSRLWSWLETHGPRRALVLIGGALILGFWLAAVVGMWTNRYTELHKVDANLERLSLVLAEHTARDLQSANLILTSLAGRFGAQGIATADDFRRGLATEDVHRMLREVIRSAPQIDALALVDDGGQVINFSRSWPMPEINAADRDFFAAQRDHPDLGLFISEPVKSRGSGSWTVYLTLRISGPDGKFVGIVAAAIETRYFEEFFRAVLRDDDGSIALFRRDGTLLAREPHFENRIGVTYSGRPLFTNALAKADWAIVHQPAGAGLFDSRARILAPRVVPDYPLVVTVGLTEEAALAPWRRHNLIVIGFAVAAAILIVLIGVLLARLFDLQAHTVAARERAEQGQAVAEAASRAKSAFLANMSHELRTPLNAIMGFAEMLGRGYFGPLNARQAESVHDINTSGHHLLGLISAVLDMSKIEAGRYELTDEVVDVAAVLNEAATFLRVRAEEGSIDVRRLPADGLPGLLADRRAVLQIVLNLVTNAVNHTGPGGRVTLSAALTPDRSLQITISDTGTGIDPRDLPHIFEPFQSSDARLSRKHGGSGLGLSISRMLVERHGGTLTLDSTLGVGTTVAVRFPADRVQPGPAGAAPQSAPTKVPAVG